MGLVAPFPRRVCGMAISNNSKHNTLLTSLIGGGSRHTDGRNRNNNVAKISTSAEIETYMQQAKQKLALTPHKLSVDVLSPMQSHLLDLALAKDLPASCQPARFERRRTNNLDLNRGFSTRLDLRYPTTPLPQGGHHLVYFPLQEPSNKLMPDGTDRDHCPGHPFTRRMWAGGSITYADDWYRKFRLDGRRACCVETVGEPTLRSSINGDKRVYVDVRRRYGLVDENLSRADDRAYDVLLEAESVTSESSPIVIDEVRRLVFLKEQTDSPLVASPVKKGKGQPKKFDVYNLVPDYTFNMTPDPTLLFQFSALTYNAHAIHFDSAYAKVVEGYRGLLVQGSLTLALMLSVLQRQCKVDNKAQEDMLWTTKSIDYRNIRPLYAGERLSVCIKDFTKEANKAPIIRTKDWRKALDGGHFVEKKENTTEKKWKLWILNSDGELAVKGTAVTKASQKPREKQIQYRQIGEGIRTIASERSHLRHGGNPTLFE
ncbi:hypothetical protein B0H66DRAFT_355853 [Apodospora peruviana]|uniref:Mesaconyl-C4 CoA hydratase n=1 Tax=Apodospora peruviana TaxID=516989 RepID=A0AAE0LZM9_9PEZI|nr:hypothetical protein B0H66DRAFT_355853 [Apodospora peruviana]